MQEELIKKIHSGNLNIEELASYIKEFHLTPDDIKAMGALPIALINGAFEIIKAEIEQERECISENQKLRNIAIEACAKAMNNENLSEEERKEAREAMKEYIKSGDSITKERINNSYNYKNLLSFGAFFVLSVVAIGLVKK